MSQPCGPCHGLTLRRPPRVDGPYDDEVADRSPQVVGALALAFPAPDRNAVPLRLVPPATDDELAAASDNQALPDARVWTSRLAQAVSEVLAGARPASQLARFATLDVLRLLERWSGRFVERDGKSGRRPVVRSVHVSSPREGVCEGCLVLDTGERRRAVALRLEGVDSRWRLTALQLG